MLLSLYYHRCLTTEQITEMHFKYKNSPAGGENSQADIVARRRIRKMYDVGLIDRFFIDVGENNGSSQGHIVLNKKGANIVAALLNCQVKDLNWRYEMNEVKLPYLQHMIEINDTYLQFLQTARTLGHELDMFRVEVPHRFKYWGSKIIVKPDAYGQYFFGEEGFHFFLEVDRGTETPAQFQKKHQRYAAFYDSNEYLKHYSTFPLILIITPTWERALQLRHVIYAADNTDINWLFTSEDLARQNIISPIWVGKGNEPVGLVG